MKRFVLSGLVAICLAAPAAALACDGEKSAHSVKTLTVEQLAALTKTKAAATVDANGEKTRTEWGVIPGAILLTSSSKFDPAKELPQTKDQALVFYCANEKCGASKAAAKKALEAGYTDVAVLPAGIQGWKNAGQPTAKPQS